VQECSSVGGEVARGGEGEREDVSEALRQHVLPPAATVCSSIHSLFMEVTNNDIKL
jgi:hypothetical protein